MAGALAQRLGLPGTPPAALIASAHKYYARLAQREAAPEATPAFALLDPEDPVASARSVGFPCFVKPVKGAFSLFARRIDAAPELRAFLARPAVDEFVRCYLRPFDGMVRDFTALRPDGGRFLAEAILEGALVTVEGFVSGDDVEFFGVTDSSLDPRTGSFVSFHFPSALEAEVQARMQGIAARVVRRLGLVDVLFNVEMTYDERRDRIGVVEVNPRMCGQFADLYAKVLGINSYEIALELATGGQPRLPPVGGAHAAAASFAQRVFAPARAARAPEPADVAAAAALFPDTMIWCECGRGQELADFERLEDGHSSRYGGLNLGAADRQALQARFDAVQARLGYRFEPL